MRAASAQSQQPPRRGHHLLQAINRLASGAESSRIEVRTPFLDSELRAGRTVTLPAVAWHRSRCTTARCASNSSASTCCKSTRGCRRSSSRPDHRAAAAIPRVPAHGRRLRRGPATGPQTPHPLPRGTGSPRRAGIASKKRARRSSEPLQMDRGQSNSPMKAMHSRHELPAKLPTQGRRWAMAGTPQSTTPARWRGPAAGRRDDGHRQPLRARVTQLARRAGRRERGIPHVGRA